MYFSAKKCGATNSKLVYYLSLFFLLPTLYCALFTISINFRILHYFGASALLIFLVLQKNTFKINTATFSRLSYFVFFLSALITFLYAMYTQYYFFATYGDDFSIFEGLLQSALKGVWGYSDYVGFYHFATHQNYILLLVLPVYALLKSALFLQLLSGVVIWLAGVLLWLIARKEVKELLAILLTIAFYLCSGTINALQTNFRPELFFPLAIFALYYSYKYAGSYLFCATLLLCLSIKEDSPLYMLGFIYLAWQEKRYTKLWLTIISTCLVVIINLFIVQPYFVAKSGLLNPPTLVYWASFGHTKSEILTNIISSPLRIISRMFNHNSGFWRIYLYCLFIPLFDIFTLLTSILGLILFTSSDYFAPHNLDLYYGLSLSSVVFIGLIRVMAKYEKSCTHRSCANQLDANQLCTNTSCVNNSHVAWLFTILLTLYPLWGSGWLQFNVDKENRYSELSLLKKRLLHDYSSYAVCPSDNLYAYFSSYDFPLHRLSYNLGSCIRVLTKQHIPDTKQIKTSEEDGNKTSNTNSNTNGYNCSYTQHFIVCQ